jgi:hypothetical protein
MNHVKLNGYEIIFYTEEGWKEFLWKVHFLGGKSMILLWHFDQLERKIIRDEQDT